MLNVGLSELIVIFVVLLVLFGIRKLPELIRSLSTVNQSAPVVTQEEPSSETPDNRS